MINRAILINIKYTGLKILFLEIISRDIAKKFKRHVKQQMFNILLEEKSTTNILKKYKGKISTKNVKLKFSICVN